MSQDPAGQLFRPYLSTWLRERIGTPELQPGVVRTCNATLLYADLSGFTRLTAAFTSLPDGAERLHDALNRCYTALIDVIGAFGGDVPSIAGDALTAWWPDRTDIDLARRCGTAMLKAVAALPPLLTPDGPFQLELRIGVSVGEVHATLAGLPHYGVHFVLTGPALAAAATAERAAPTGALAIAAPVPLTLRQSSESPGSEPGTPLSWEHFLHPNFAERLRQNELIAEYRRCVPVFAAFTVPRRAEDLHPLVAQVQAVVNRWGGWLNEIEVGDKGAVFVLLFGAPLARGDDPSRAVGCCLELRERELISHAGITLGILFVGAVGSAQRRVYTAQGDDMNLAAHLMERAAPGEILVSGRVRHDVMDRYKTDLPTMIATKGHLEGVPVARMLTGGPRTQRAPGMMGRYLPDAAALVGREGEWRSINAAAERARAGQLALLLVEGESGIGKSCMLQGLFLSWVEAGLAGSSAECSSGSAPSPLLAWRPILLDLCAVGAGDPPRAQLAQLERALEPLPRAIRAELPLLALALGIGGARAELTQPLTTVEQHLLIAAAALLVEHQAAQGPLLIVLEDIHWADEASLQLAVELLRPGVEGRRSSLCLALSHRPLDGPPSVALAALRAHPGVIRVTVGRLSSDEIIAMISAQLNVQAVHDDLRQHVERYTEGQPLFIKEYLRVLRQHDLVRVEDGVARLVKSYVTVQVSSSAQGVIQARVDRLDMATRLTLKVAAVLGRSFSLRLLDTIHPARPAPTTLREQLNTLVELQIIDLELEDPERVYRFKYGITHEVAYTSLLFGQRRQLHAAVADWYEQGYAHEIAGGSAAMAVFDVLIDHLGRAEQWERQAHYCQMAAEQAARQFATGAALRYIEQALVFTQRQAGRFALLLLRVALNERVGNQVIQAEDLDQLDALATQLGGQLPRAYSGYFRLRYLLAMGFPQLVVTQAAAALRRLQRAEQRAEGAEQRELRVLGAATKATLAAARASLGLALSARGMYRRALDLCWAEEPVSLSGLAALVALDTRSIAARCLDGLGGLDLAAGQFEQAMQCQRQALELARAAGDWCAEARARTQIGKIHLARGQSVAALEETRAALTTSNAVGDRAGQTLALRQLAAISAAGGDYAAATRDAHYALAISAGARARMLEAQLWDDMAYYANAQGLEEEATAARLEAERARRARMPSAEVARLALATPAYVG